MRKLCCSMEARLSLIFLGFICLIQAEDITESPSSTENSFLYSTWEPLESSSFEDNPSSIVTFLTPSTDSVSLDYFKEFRFLEWLRQPLLMAMSESEVVVFKVSSSSNEIYLDDFLKVPRQDFLRTDQLKILVHGDALWVFESSTEGEMVVITQVNLGLATRTLRPPQQILPIQSKIGALHPLATHNRTILLIAHQSDANENGQLKIFSLERNLWIPEGEIALRCLPHEIDAVPYADGLLYLAIRCDEMASIFILDPSELTLKEIWSATGHFLQFTLRQVESLKDHLTILIRDGNTQIYFVKGEEVTLWRELETLAEPVSGSPFSVPTGEFIVLTNEDETIAYGLEPEGETVFSLPDTCHRISVDVISDAKALIGITCSEQSQNRIIFMQLNYRFESEMQMDVPVEDSKLHECFEELDVSLQRHRTDIESFLKVLRDGLLVTSDEDQVLTEKVDFKSVEADEVEGTNLALEPPSDFLEISHRISELRTKILSLGARSKVIEGQLPNLMTFGTDQHIGASVNIEELVVDRANILAIDLEEVNGVSLEDYKTKFLLLDGDQDVKTNLYFDKLITKNVNTEELVNNVTTVLPQDLFSSKNSSQIVTGKHSFSSIEVRGDIIPLLGQSSIEINGIDSDELVKSFSDVHFTGSKIFQESLLVKNWAEIKYLNGVNFDAWRSSLVRMDEYFPTSLGAPFIVNGDVTVTGDVKVNTINGVDVVRMFENGVKRSSPFQVVKGPVAFKGLLETTQMEVERVEDVPWKNYLRKRDDILHAKFNIDDGVVLGNLECDSINGLDIDKDVLVSGLDQSIEGRVTFFSDVNVTGSKGVTMAPGATINGIDPSLHSSFGPGFDQEVISKELSFGEVLEVRGDIRVTSVNGKPFPDFENDRWRKSTAQRIPGDVTIRRANFRKSIYASSLNGFKIEDYMLANEEQTLTGQNFFTSDVIVHKDFDTEDGGTVNGVHLPTLSNTAMNLDGDQVIEAETIFLKEISVENLSVEDGMLMNISIENELFGNSFPGKLIFKEAVEANSVKAKNMKLNSLNGKSAEAVLLQKPPAVSEIRGNLHIGDLTVDELTVSNDLNGRNFSAWLEDTISTTAPSVRFTHPVSIRDGSFSGSLDVNVVNGNHLQTYLNQIVRDCEGCWVTGHKIFTQPLEVFGDLEADYINGVSLNELKERLLSRTRPQTIKSRFSFSEGLIATTLETPSISGFPVNDIVLTNEPAEFKAPVRFQSDVLFGKVYSEDGWIDGCNIEQVLNPPLRNVGNLVTSNVTLGHLKIEGRVKVDGKIFSGPNRVDVAKFLKDVVKKSQDQVISGPVTFQGPVFTHSLFTRTINKISTKEFLRRLWSPKMDVHTSCDVTFEEVVALKTVVDTMPSTGVLLNNISLDTISKFGVRKNWPGVITGTKTFLSNVSVIGNLEVKEINGVVIEKLIKLDDKYFGSHLKFSEPVHISKDLKVQGLIAGVEPDVLFKPFIDTKVFPTILPSEYGTVTVEGDLLVDSINGVRLDDLALTSSEFQTFSGSKKILGGIYVDGSCDVGRLNGIDLDQFKEWSEISTLAKSDRFVRTLFTHETGESLKALLEKTAFRLRSLNDENFQLAQGLHRKLLFITEEDRVALTRVKTVSYFGNFNVMKIYGIVNFEECATWRFCPCLETHLFEVSDLKLNKSEDFLKGHNFPVVFRELESHLFNFHVSCSGNQVETMFSHFHLKMGAETLATTENLFYGQLVQVLPFFINQRGYFVLLTKSNEQVFKLKVLRINLVLVLEMELEDIEVATIDLKEIQGIWHLLVTREKKDDDYSNGSTLLYTWNVAYEKFDIARSFPPATTGKIVSFGNEGYLLLAQNDSPPQQCAVTLEGDLKVYTSVNGSRFEPFATISVFGISDIAYFFVEEDLHIISSSYLDHEVSIHRLVKYEGFEAVTSFSVEHPTSVAYGMENGSHFVSVASGSSHILILKLHFEGSSAWFAGR